jgi:hypothetical protein
VTELIELVEKLENQIHSALLFDPSNLEKLWRDSITITSDINHQLAQKRSTENQILISRLVRAQSRLLRASSSIHRQLAQRRCT